MVKSDKKWRGGGPREKQQTFNIINNVDLQNRLVKRNPVSKKKKKRGRGVTNGEAVRKGGTWGASSKSKIRASPF